MRLVVILTIVLFSPAFLFSAVLKVPSQYATIQDALDAASPSGDTILVAEGLYVENIDFLGKDVWLRSDGDGNPATKDLKPETTVIDGNQAGSVVTFQNGEGNSAVLEGFTVTNGTGTSDPFGSMYGGGLYCYMSDPTIRVNILTQNHADHGGGISCYDHASPVIEQNYITMNTAESGAGISCYDHSNPKIKNNGIFENTAEYYGGGINCRHFSHPSISNNTIRHNKATLFYGGGIGCYGDSNPFISRNYIHSNTADFGGGGISYETASDNSTPLEVFENRIVNNTANQYRGGGVLLIPGSDQVSVAFVRNLIAGNTALSGGGMECQGCDPIIFNNLFFDNDATGTVGEGIGGGMNISDSDADIRFVTVSDNTASEFGGGIGCKDSAPVIKNSIIWSNFAPNKPEIFPGSPEVSHCNVSGGWPGVNNFDADPLFEWGPDGFYYLSQTAAGQPANSPCVDAGDVTAGSVGLNLVWTRTDEVTDSGMADLGFHYGDFSGTWGSGDPLMASSSQISAAGGSVSFSLNAGAANANRNYFLLGSASGTVPGTPLPGGTVVLPLNWDILTAIVFQFANTPVLVDFNKTLNAQGKASAQMNVLSPLPPAAVGLVLNFAFLLYYPFNYVSNAVPITIVS